MGRRHKKLVHEGEYAAKVKVELIEEGEGWPLYLSPEDAERLDAVRDALRRSDLREAGRVALRTPNGGRMDILKDMFMADAQSKKWAQTGNGSQRLLRPPS
jgi:hypothetical protein